MYWVLTLEIKKNGTILKTKFLKTRSYEKVLDKVKELTLKNQNKDIYINVENPSIRFEEYYKDGELIFRIDKTLDSVKFQGKTRPRFLPGEIVDVVSFNQRKKRLGIVSATPLSPSEIKPKLNYDYYDNVYLVSFLDKQKDHEHVFEFQLRDSNNVNSKIKNQLKKLFKSYKNGEL